MSDQEIQQMYRRIDSLEGKIDRLNHSLVELIHGDPSNASVPGLVGRISALEAAHRQRMASRDIIVAIIASMMSGGLVLIVQALTY